MQQGTHGGAMFRTVASQQQFWVGIWHGILGFTCSKIFRKPKEVFYKSSEDKNQNSQPKKKYLIYTSD